jgi:hypothetical protein
MDPFIIANFIPCFHCVKLHYFALVQLRDRGRPCARFFVRFNGAHRFSLALEQFLVYINANRQESSSRALVQDKSNSVANGSRRFLSIPLSRTDAHTRARAHTRTCILPNMPLEDGDAAWDFDFQLVRAVAI